MQINRAELVKLYMEEMNAIAEECDWVTHFGPEEIVNIIAHVLERNPQLIKE